MPESLLDLRLPLFPITTAVTHPPNRAVDVATDFADGPILTIGGCNLAALADEYDTPLYLYDQATMDAAADAYRSALSSHYPGSAGVTFAGKALLMTAAAQWVDAQGFVLDCTGAGELHIAVDAGLSPAQILVHGVNKSEADLDAAIVHAGVIVVDNLVELERLATRHQAGSSIPQLWLRVRPGLAVDTHAYRQTGQDDSKFGLSVDEAHRAVSMAQTSGLRVTGLHFHQGSQFFDPTPIGPALTRVLALVNELHAQHDWLPEVISPGGGWGVAYHEDELPQPEIERYVRFIAEHLAAGCADCGLPLPRLQVEPGRSLVARAGVALYRVGAEKRTPQRRWVLLDGGMADNPRPALYGVRYSALPVFDPARPAVGAAWLAGPYCESGDVLIEAIPLPRLAAGELVAIPASGAYHLNMGSNYNGARRPAVLWLHDGAAHLVQRREQTAELTQRDLPLPSSVSTAIPNNAQDATSAASIKGAI